MNRSDLFFSQQNMNLLCRDESCSVYQMKNETGDGTATYYEVYPGIGVMYNDFHMSTARQGSLNKIRTLLQFTIAEKAASSGSQQWRLSLSCVRRYYAGQFCTENNHCSFPVSHYHGITITISVPEAVEGLGDLLSLFSIDLEQIEQQFTLKIRPFIMHGNSVPDHVIRNCTRCRKISVWNISG